VHRILDSCEVNWSHEFDSVTKYSGASCEIFLSFVVLSKSVKAETARLHTEPSVSASASRDGSLKELNK